MRSYMAKPKSMVIAERESVSINPATGEAIARFAYAPPTEVEKILAAVETGFRVWRAMPIGQRAGILESVAKILRSNAEDYAQHMTQEMGKLVAESKAEVEKCAFLCEWFAQHGPAMLADEPMSMPDKEAYVSYLPLGPILGVMPWNFPFWQAMRAAVPILLGGNCFVLKHAHNVMRCAYDLEDAWRQAGLPEGVFSVLHVPSDDVAAIIGDRRIAGVTLTGSGRAGASVAAQAGKLCKKSLLELGGSDPFIVLADANLDGAVEAGIKARFNNAGQVCIAAKRFILEAPIAEAFTEKFVARARSLKPGDPFHAATTLAPIARGDLRDTLDAQVQTTIKQGARLLCGGSKISGPGFFYEATVLGDVMPGMASFDEETFGPVAALTVAADAEEAIALANHSHYGLSGNLWTGDIARATAIARRLETGAVFINGFSTSDPRAPIGGVKQSGYGRELSHFGIHEFVNAQAVVTRS
jgi:succinate-semialdehyde dehydrogenase